MKNVISVQLKKDETVLKISEDVEQKDIMQTLRKKLPDLRKMYKNEKIPIRVTGKALKNREMDEIQRIIQSIIEVNVDFDTPKSFGLSSIKKTFEQKTIVSETTFHRGSLRSGQKLEVDGSVVILGDVNSGAEVIAADNIIVIGTLRGLAHAGAKGNKEAIIAASTLDVVQLRISNIVMEIDREEENVYEHAYIYVDDDKIVIE